MNENNKAIDMLVDKIVSVTESKTQNLKYDKTFQSTVWKVNSDGTYGINYLGQMYNVPNASGFILTLGQKVWVKIPSGIFRNMIITGIDGENSSTGGTGGNIDLSKYCTKEEVKALINQRISELDTGVLSVSVNGVKVETDENGNVNLDISSSGTIEFETEDIDFNTEY